MIAEVASFSLLSTEAPQTPTASSSTVTGDPFFKLLFEQNPLHGECGVCVFFFKTINGERESQCVFIFILFLKQQPNKQQ